MARNILAIAFAIVAVWVGVLNWSVFWQAAVRKRHVPSWIPLLAGVSGLIAGRLSPWPPVRSLSWLALILDYGSFPGLIQTAYFYFVRNQREP